MDYDRLRAEQGELRTRGIYRGIGIATFVEIINPDPTLYGVGGARISSQDGAILKITPSGEVRCLISVTELGQGTETIIGQIVADNLGVDRERIKVIPGDTEVTPFGGATYACRGAGIGGEAALQATRQLKKNLLSVAAVLLQDEAGKLDTQRGWMSRPKRDAAALNAVNDAMLPFRATISQVPMTPAGVLKALSTSSVSLKKRNEIASAPQATSPSTDMNPPVSVC